MDEDITPDDATGMEGPWQWREAQAAKAAQGDDTAESVTGGDDLDNLDKAALLTIAEDEGVDGVDGRTKNSDIADAIRAKRAEA